LLEKEGVKPILGTLDDTETVAESARDADGVINAASSDHRALIETLVKALAGTVRFVC
jgi:hypothetical protein